MYLENIHAIRKSLYAIRQLVLNKNENLTWLSALDASKWFNYLGGLLKAAMKIASYVHYKGQPVLVHCSDGWDRTPQLTGLSQLLLDPYYRTFYVSCFWKCLNIFLTLSFLGIPSHG